MEAPNTHHWNLTSPNQLSSFLSHFQGFPSDLNHKSCQAFCKLLSGSQPLPYSPDCGISEKLLNSVKSGLAEFAKVRGITIDGMPDDELAKGFYAFAMATVGSSLSKELTGGIPVPGLRVPLESLEVTSQALALVEAEAWNGKDDSSRDEPVVDGNENKEAKESHSKKEKEQQTTQGAQQFLFLKALSRLGKPKTMILDYPVNTTRKMKEQCAQENGAVGIREHPHEVQLGRALHFEAYATPANPMTICLHDLHDQPPPGGAPGAHHHISFTSFPSCSNESENKGKRDWNSMKPFLCSFNRELQLIPIVSGGLANLANRQKTIDGTTCKGEKVKTAKEWNEGKEVEDDLNLGTFTVYNAGAMLRHLPEKPELSTSAHIQENIKARVRDWYGGEDGCPEKQLSAILESIKFVDQEGDEALICGGCGRRV